MKFKGFLSILPIAAVLLWTVSESAPIHPASADPLTTEQETALKSLVQDLEQIKSDPENLKTIQEQIAEEQKRAQTGIEEIDRKISELNQAISDSEKTQQELVDRLKALQTGKFLLQQTKSEEPTKTEEIQRPVAKLTSAKGKVDFRKQIRPILSNKCFLCHGPDEEDRKAGLRLDLKEHAFGERKSGKHPIVPGDLEASLVYHRITTTDEADRMPPAGFEKQLTQEEIDLITQWIAEGAHWEQHWSFVPPKRPEIPETQLTDWAKNPIDSFVLSKLEENGLEPTKEADRRSLIRRLYLDLTGIPPTPQELHRFLEDDSPDAYEKEVDRLISSPHYGEEMARRWMDLARYADTHGYHIDSERYMWRWREWVINAFNNNKPFDEFTVEQLAGDLLDHPTLDQKIATGFNRNHMINYEGGAIPEEYRTQYVFDRVQTMGTTWMGLTLECAKCHDHKYDPVSQKEFYQFTAFFNTISEKGLDGQRGNAEPMIKAPDEEQRTKLAAYDSQISDLKTELDRPIPELDEAQSKWENEVSQKLQDRWTALNPSSATSIEGASMRVLEDKSVLTSGANPEKDVYEVVFPETLANVQAIRLEALTDESFVEGGTGRSENANFVLSEFEVELKNDAQPDQVNKVELIEAQADHSQEGFDIANAIDGNAETGWGVDGYELRENRSAIFTPKTPISTGEGIHLKVRLKHESQYAGHNIGRFRVSVSSDPTMAPSSFGKWYVSGPFKAVDGQTAYKTAYEPEQSIDLEATYEDGRQKWTLATPMYEDGKIHPLSGDVAATYLYRTIQSPSDRSMKLSVGSNDAVKVWLNGHVVHDNDVQRGVDDQRDEVVLNLSKGENQLLMKVVNYGNQYAFFFDKAEEQMGEYPTEIETILTLAKEDRSEGQKEQLRNFYRQTNSPEWREQKQQLADLEQKRKEFDESIPTTMVMSEMSEPRETHFLVRGQYDQPGDVVHAAIPAVFPALPEKTEPNRLGLAKWLVSDKHPLTARVTVNRYWQHYFGTGIVKTAEDFGSQGEWPSHPELLDWLAVEFMESDWDVKHIQKLIVTSAAYRQASVITPDRLEKDPKNRLISRGPRYRLEAELVRDNALAIAGLLNRKIGGSSVKPYQPEGLWEEVAYGSGFSAQSYDRDDGSDLYRRGMYTFWKRQCPPPGMLVFDAPNREVCTSRRERTNTPLQALALMNDPVYLEAARVLAQRMMIEGGGTPQAKVAYAFERATCRLPNEKETEILLNIYGKQLEDYRSDTEAAEKFVSVGESPIPENLDKADLAAWTTVASMILNLDEAITKS
ncbi:MAG: DUF1553 domain-containing protein [Candidatus Omnitrophica bacterium]|nr:DUF1553 domain-containing protein [Candidatus Omnitrophota bacterium]